MSGHDLSPLPWAKTPRQTLQHRIGMLRTQQAVFIGCPCPAWPRVWQPDPALPGKGNGGKKQGPQRLISILINQAACRWDTDYHANMEITGQPIALGILDDKMADLSAINIYCSNFTFLTFQAKRKCRYQARYWADQVLSCKWWHSGQAGHGTRPHKHRRSLLASIYWDPTMCRTTFWMLG